MGGKKSGQSVRRRQPQTVQHGKDELSKFAHDYSKDYADPNWPYHHGRMDKCAIVSLIVFPIAIISGITYVWYNAQLKNMVKTPLNVPKIISPEITSNNSEMFWGTYRSSLYFGLKTRSPHSPVAGLMWMSQMTNEIPPSIRHWCTQDDGLPMYGWFVHDGKSFGHQEIMDKYYSLTTDFVKRPGGEHGGDWSARVKVEPQKGAEAIVMSLFFYMALDGEGYIKPEVKNNKLVAITGHTAELGDFRMVFPQSSKPAKMNYLAAVAPGLDKLKEVIMRGVRVFKWDRAKNLDYIGLVGNMVPRDAESGPNFIVHQVTVNLPFQLVVMFESGSFLQRPEPLLGEAYHTEITNRLVEFDERFEKTFQLKDKGYDAKHISFAKAALSNMLGSIGYFYGSSLVKSRYITDEPVSYWKAPLFTAVPSRSFFPRGFLWDEGFHNLLLMKWDMRLSMDIIGHWLDLMNIEGWIPREQILGVEAHAKVPEQFVVQHNENANPPTLFLPLQSIVKMLIQSDKPSDKEYLKNLYPRLKTWFDWFNTTQTGNERSTYFWRGRDANTKHELNPKTLTSGLDDYPRASHPSDLERHVDLRCWMALAASVMADIGRSLNESWQEFAAARDLLTDNKLLDELHWSEKKNRYSDYGLHTDQVKLERTKVKPTPGKPPQHQPQKKVRTVQKNPEYRFVDSHFGYVSLFPFLLKIVESDSLKLGQILKDIQDPNLLWTKYGLRSLAKSSPLYHKANTEDDPPYWRGAIWINMNYLTLSALHHYSTVAGPYQDTAKQVYGELRQNIVNNIYNQYMSTGYIWEQYDDNTGNGKGSHPFTGWSALVVAIMAEQY